MSRRYYFAVFFMLAIVILFSACGSSATAEPSPIPPASTPVPPTSTSTSAPPATPTIAPTRIAIPTQAMFPPQQQALEDTFGFIKQKYGADLVLMEIGYLSLDGGKSYTNLMVKVRCMSGDCATGTLYQWVIVSIAPFKNVPETLAVFNIQVYGQQDEVLEHVTGRWTDLMELQNRKIGMEELLGRLMFVR